jgi:hypothetical protein
MGDSRTCRWLAAGVGPFVANKKPRMYMRGFWFSNCHPVEDVFLNYDIATVTVLISV